MPRIPIISSGSQAVVASAPRVYGVDTGGTLVAQHGLNTLSQSLSNIAVRIQQEKSETELIKNQYSYDPDLQRIRKEVLSDPTIENPFITFNERAAELQQTYLEGIQNPNVKRAFSNHIAKTFPQVQQDALDDALKLQNQKNIAGLHETADLLSTTAATGTPEQRNQAIIDFNDKIDRSAASGTINAIQATDMKKAFRVTTMTKNMTAMALNDPYKLFQLDQEGAYSEVDAVTRLEIRKGARTQIESADAERERIFKQAQKGNEDYYGNLANQGLIPESEMEMMIRGQHPYITNPVLIRTLSEVNANPIEGKTSQQVETILLDFRALSMASPEKVLEATQKARGQLDHYRSTMSKRDPSLLKAYKELQAAELTIAAAERSARGEVRAEARDVRAVAAEERAAETAKQTAIHREIQIATELYKTIPKPITPGGPMGKFQQNKEIVDLNEIHGLVRNGMKAKDAVDLIQKKRKEQGSGIPSRNEPVTDLVR